MICGADHGGVQVGTRTARGCSVLATRCRHRPPARPALILRSGRRRTSVGGPTVWTKARGIWP